MALGTFVIAIAGHSGAGKSTVIENLVARLGNANSLNRDDYESSSIYPSTLKWIEDGADPDAFQSPQFVTDITTLKNGKEIVHPITGKKTKAESFLIIEEPVGRERSALQDLIDFVVYLDVPLHIAYARKLARKSEFLPWQNTRYFYVEPA